MVSNADAVNPERIGARLRAMRRAQGLKQKEVAQISGLLRENIARLEAGRGWPSLQTIEKVCTALNVDIALVFLGDL